MPAWILDENVFKRSLEAACTTTAENVDAAKVMEFVQLHGKWVFTDAIRIKYWVHWKGRSCNGSLTLRLLKSFQELMWDADRSILLEDVPVVAGDYHDDDEFVVSAAAAAPADAVLVTDDSRLRDALVAEGIPDQKGFRVVGIAQAVAIQAEL